MISVNDAKHIHLLPIHLLPELFILQVSTIHKPIPFIDPSPSIKLIKEHIQKENNDFNIKAASVGQINKVLKSLNPKKATGPDKIPVSGQRNRFLSV